MAGKWKKLSLITLLLLGSTCTGSAVLAERTDQGTDGAYFQEM